MCYYITFLVQCILYNSLLYFILHSPLSFVGPKIALKIFFSKTPKMASSDFDNTHVSEPYGSTGLIKVLPNFISFVMDTCLYLIHTSGTNAQIIFRHISLNNCSIKIIPVFFLARQSSVDLGLLIFEVPRSHSDTSHSVGLIWTGERPVTETSTWRHSKLTTDKHTFPQRHSNQQYPNASGLRRRCYRAQQ